MEQKVTNNSIMVGENGFAVNRDHLVIDKLLPCNVANVIEEFAAADKPIKDSSIAVYAMAAFVDDPSIAGGKRLANNATLINEGIIEIHMRDLLETYVKDVKSSPDDKEHPYDFVSCYALVVGKNSMIINNGTIRIIEDQPAEMEVPIYASALKGANDSTFINNGTIEYVGNGTYSTHVRATMCRNDNPTIVNMGKINVDVERSATVRILATIAHGGSIINYGDIHVDSSGRIMTMARFANTQIVNEGKIDVVSRAHFIVNKVAFLYQSYPLACAFYEHSFPNPMRIPPIVNHGNVKIHLEGSEEATPQAVAFGVYSEMVGMEEQPHRFENTGSIELSQNGPHKYLTAEIGCNCQAHKDYPYKIEIQTWHTRNRDFAKTRDLFACGSGIFDFSNTTLTIAGENDGKQIKAEDLIVQSQEQLERGDTIKIENSDKLKIEYNK